MLDWVNCKINFSLLSDFKHKPLTPYPLTQSNLLIYIYCLYASNQITLWNDFYMLIWLSECIKSHYIISLQNLRGKIWLNVCYKIV